ncbi:MAG: ABC transporter permease [Candidatus Dormibacteraeota bacterium]|uniref:Transport permease protein n=1 Tax=Candidatus Amunia macphersoniae TaxID=3127014 RepID=A0A934KRU0_9BACT|nr:ABC transporter permease [Candidatus Dormibacteraeota bacterium]
MRAGLRNRVAMFFTLGLAFLFMVIFGLLFGGNNFSVTYGVVDSDHSPQSQKFIGALGGIHGVTTTVESKGQALNDLRNNHVDVVVEIPQGFGAALGNPGGAQVTVRPTQASQTSSTASVADQILAEVLNGFTANGARSAVVLAPPATSAVNKITAIDYFLPAMIAYIILQSGINYVAIGLADLRARKVLRRFRATPLRPVQILGAQIAGGALTVVLQLLVLIVAGLLLFQAKVYGSWLVALVPMVLGIGAFVGIGFLLTSAARTSESARGLSTFVAFPMMFLSGIFFPITTLPSWLQTVVHVLPLTWLTDAMHRVMNDGVGLADIALDCLVLAAWAVVTFAIATWRFRWD